MEKKLFFCHDFIQNIIEKKKWELIWVFTVCVNIVNIVGGNSATCLTSAHLSFLLICVLHALWPCAQAEGSHWCTGAMERLSHLFCSLMRAPCIVSMNRAHWPCGICMRMVYVYWNSSTLFLSFCNWVVFSSALQSSSCYQPFKILLILTALILLTSCPWQELLLAWRTITPSCTLHMEAIYWRNGSNSRIPLRSYTVWRDSR